MNIVHILYSLLLNVI